MVEVNVAIICSSLLVMKPLFSRLIPAMVSEQPAPAKEDKRAWRDLTGLTLLGEGVRKVADEEKAELGERNTRRDTAVAMDESGEAGKLPGILQAG
jgi:hypothetical protein